MRVRGEPSAHFLPFAGLEVTRAQDSRRKRKEQRVLFWSLMLFAVLGKRSFALGKKRKQRKQISTNE